MNEFLKTRQEVLRISGLTFIQYRQPLVYGWYRNEKYLYIGSSQSGIGRIFSDCHHIFTKYEFSPTDDIHIWFCEEYKTLERSLIKEYKPLLNKRSRY